MGRPCTMPASMLCAIHNARFVCKPLGRASSSLRGRCFPRGGEMDFLRRTHASGGLLQVAGSLRTPPEGSCKLREASVRLRKVPASCGKPPYVSGRFLQVAGSLRTSPEREFDVSSSFADTGMGRPCTMPASMLCATHNARFVCKPLGRASSPRRGDRFLTSNSR